MPDEISSTPAPAGGPSQVENLDDLAREARAVDQVEQLKGPSAAIATAQQLQDREEQQQLQQDVVMIAGLLGQVRDLAGAMAEEAGYLRPGRVVAIWTDQALGNIAGPLVQVMQRHGGDMGEWFKQYGPYLALLAAAAMPLGKTAREIREARAAREVPTAPGPGQGADA